MSIGEVLKPATSMFGDTLGGLAKYSWVLFLFVGIGIAVAIVFFYYMIKQKKAQWTHTLEVKRILKNNLLSDPIVHKMRRFPLIKGAEVFELETPLLGSYLIPEPGKYSGLNKYSIILDSDNRIWMNEGEYFVPSDCSCNVSARHAEIDLQVSTLKSDFQDINKINKRIDWAQMAKYALSALLILAVMIVAIVGIGEWGEAQERRSEEAKATTATMEFMAEAQKTNLEVANTNILILQKLKELYGTENIQGVIKNVKNN
jgi:predicted small secreted protein